MRTSDLSVCNVQSSHVEPVFDLLLVVYVKNVVTKELQDSGNNHMTQ